MLETKDLGDVLGDVGYGFSRFCHPYLLFFNIHVGHQDSKDVTNIHLLPTSMLLNESLLESRVYNDVKGVMLTVQFKDLVAI